jgi:Skp family chaperone for outer membrane proteins
MNPHFSQQGVLTVKTLSLFVAVFVSILVTPLHQAAAQNQPGTRIALLDIDEVFKNYRRYKAMMADVRKDEEALEALVRGKAKQLTAMRNEIRDFKPGTAAYQKLEATMAKLKADTTVDTDIKRKGFIIRRSKASHTAYLDITRAVGRFAEANGISLVMAYDNREVDAANPNQVMYEINRQIIYQRSLNITSYIVEALNAGVPPAEVGTRPGAPPRPGSR